eukprot:SAG22_NODE_6945_length_792_cov_1.405483_1_plen_66_part_10
MCRPAPHGGDCTIKIVGGDPGGEPDFSAAPAIGGSFACGGNTPLSKAITVPADLPSGDAVLQWYWD